MQPSYWLQYRGDIGSFSLKEPSSDGQKSIVPLLILRRLGYVLLTSSDTKVVFLGYSDGSLGKRPLGRVLALGVAWTHAISKMTTFEDLAKLNESKFSCCASLLFNVSSPLAGKGGGREGEGDIEEYDKCCPQRVDETRTFNLLKTQRDAQARVKGALEDDEDEGTVPIGRVLIRKKTGKSLKRKLSNNNNDNYNNKGEYGNGELLLGDHHKMVKMIVEVLGLVRVAVRLRPKNLEELVADVDFADCVELQPNSDTYQFDEILTKSAFQKHSGL
eukprot:Gb_03267 [translate_table: standard]